MCELSPTCDSRSIRIHERNRLMAEAAVAPETVIDRDESRARGAQVSQQPAKFLGTQSRILRKQPEGVMCEFLTVAERPEGSRVNYESPSPRLCRCTIWIVAEIIRLFVVAVSGN